MIVNVNSKKGGVGKTTLALTIAFERLRQCEASDRPAVVLIDADVFGSELCDMLLPWEGEPPDTWSLALLDLLVQSTGGDTTLAALIEDRLGRGLAGDAPLPLVRPYEDRPPLLVIPSFRQRDPAERRRRYGDGRDTGSRLDLTLLAESVGRIQLELRLTALVDVLLRVVRPELIVIDHAPFHFPLTLVTQRWAEPGVLERLLHDREARARWSGHDLRHLDVAGPDEQDVRALLPELLDDRERKTAHARGRRWALNRDVHHPGATGLDGCNTRRLLEPGLGPWRELAHAPLNPNLLLGLHGRNTLGVHRAEDTEDVEVTPRETPVTMLDLLARACAADEHRPRVVNEAGTGFQDIDWLTFLQ